MRRILFLLSGLTMTLTVTAGEHPLTVRAELVNAPCIINLPDLIDMGDISVSRQKNSGASFRGQTKTLTGAVTCPAPVKLNIRLSSSPAMNNTAHFQQNNVSGSLQVILGEESASAQANEECYAGNDHCPAQEQHRALKNWPITLVATLAPDGNAAVSPGEIRFATTMAIDYE